jgi:hypothetical protein
LGRGGPCDLRSRGYRTDQGDAGRDQDDDGHRRRHRTGEPRTDGEAADGTYDLFYIPSTIKRFETLKVGVKITARYYENMVLQLKPPGAKPVDTGSTGVMKAEGGNPAVTSSRQRTITATIAAIDPTVLSVTFTGRTAGNTAAGWNTRKRSRQ